jgi:hypothetical protein
MSWQQEAERRRLESLRELNTKTEAQTRLRKREEVNFWKKHVTLLSGLLDDIGRQWQTRQHQPNAIAITMQNCYRVKVDRNYMEIGLTLWHGNPDMRLPDQRIGSELDQPLSGAILISLLAEPTSDKNYFLLFYAAGRPGWDCETPEQFTEFRALRSRIQALWRSGELITEGFHYFNCKTEKLRS